MPPTGRPSALAAGLGTAMRTAAARDALSSGADMHGIRAPAPQRSARSVKILTQWGYTAHRDDGRTRAAAPAHRGDPRRRDQDRVAQRPYADRGGAGGRRAAAAGRRPHHALDRAGAVARHL